MAEDSQIFGGMSTDTGEDVGPIQKLDPLVLKVRKEKSAAREMLDRQKKESDRDRDYYDAEQWSDADRRNMKSGMVERPALTFDKCKPIVDMISGMERLNRQDSRFVSRALDSPIEEDAAGDLATEGVAVALDQSHGAEERSRAIKDCAIGGIGFTEGYTDYETLDPDGTVGLRWVDYSEMGWSANARKENLEDSDCFWRDRYLPKKDILRRWPDAEPYLKKDTPSVKSPPGTSYRLVTPFWSQANQEANGKQEGNDKPKDSALVTQFQWKEMEPLYRIIDTENPEGPLKNFRKLEWDDYKDELKAQGAEIPPFVRQLTPVFKQIYVLQDQYLLDEEPIELAGGFTFNPITGLWHKKKKFWYGIVRALRDPQDVLNKSISSSLHYHLSNAKGGVMFEPAAFENPAQAKVDWAKMDAWIPLQPGGKDKILQRQSIPIPQELSMFYELASHQFYEGTGINKEMVGYAQGDTPSNTGKARIQAGLAVLGWFFDNCIRFQKNEARMLLELIREFWTHGQLIQVGGDFNSRAIPLLKDSLPGKLGYMLVLEESMRHSPNQKAQVWADLQPIIPSLLRFGFGRFLLYILRFSPLPTQLVNMIHREAAENGQQQKPGGKGKQESPELTAAKVGKVTADTELVKAKTENARADRGVKIAKLVLEGTDNAHQHAHDAELARHRQVVDIVKSLRARRQGSQGGPNGQEGQ